MLTSIQEWISRYEHYENTARRQKPLVEYITFFINTPFFQTLILLTILVNAITVGDEARVVSTQIDFNTPNIYHLLNLTYLAIYTLEFSLKCYINPIGYWRTSKNIFDFIILILSLSQWIIALSELHSDLIWVRVLNALRVLRIVSVVAYSPSLKVVVTALLRTLQYHVLDILVLLLLVMFVAGVFGNTVFGQDGGNAAFEDWGTLGDAFMTLFVVVCGDGWLPYQQRLENDGYPYSELFVSTFFFVGNVIIANLFIGVICQNIRDATEDEAVERTRKRRAAKAIKKELFLRKQKQDMSHLTHIENKKFQDVIQELAGTLRHDDYVPMNAIIFNLQWLETFVVTLTHKENTMYRCQQLQFAMAETLAEYMDRRLKSRMKNDR
ncbi:Ion transport protein-domain-containing protein [Chytridium lagenaria]|nr:Ion transport protein-domain-containing protein [Chytridium lagenaria]